MVSFSAVAAELSFRWRCFVWSLRRHFALFLLLWTGSMLLKAYSDLHSPDLDLKMAIFIVLHLLGLIYSIRYFLGRIRHMIRNAAEDVQHERLVDHVNEDDCPWQHHYDIPEIVMYIAGTWMTLWMFCCFMSTSLLMWPPYKTSVTVKDLTVHEFYIGEDGTDSAIGFPTKMVTTNCSVTMEVYNQETNFDLFVGPMPVFLNYRNTVVASGCQTEQRVKSKSNLTLSVNLVGRKVPVPLSLWSTAATKKVGLPFTLVVYLRSGVVIFGYSLRFIREEHPAVSCSVRIELDNVEPMKLGELNVTI